MDFIYYIASSTPLLWINTIEYTRAIKTLSTQCKTLLNMCCFKWDITEGIHEIIQDDQKKSNVKINNDEITPIQPINFICNLETNHNIIFCKDFHLFINNNQSVDLWRTLLNNIDIMKNKNNIFVIISPFISLINEINRYFTIIDFDMPDTSILMNILQNIIHQNRLSLSKEQCNNIIKNGLGLTTNEFEDTIYFSLSKFGEIKDSVIYNYKKELIKKSQCLSIYKSTYGFSRIVGLDKLKKFTKQMVFSQLGKGVLLLGVPGTGKSEFAKCLGYETNRLTISLNFGDLMGGLVGETEQKTKNALKLIDNLSPCILFIDEIEKGLSGMNGANTDSGVSKRQGGTFLSWLNDHNNDIYVIATANNITSLPDELLRAERWDCIFFIDFPCKTERNDLLKYYKKVYNISDNNDVNILGYTGAEIKTLCRLASGLKITLKEAQDYVSPIYKVANKKMQELRAWARNRTINASDYSQENFKENDINRIFVTNNGVRIPREEL